MGTLYLDSMTSFPSQNRLLSSLRPEELQLLGPLLVRVDLPLGTALEKVDAPIEHAYFMESGFASVVAGGKDREVETALIGFEGMTAVNLLLGDDHSINKTFIQAEGSAMRIAAADLRHALSKCPSLHGFLLRYALAFSAQVSQTAVVNGRATIEKRLARWLLMAQDRFSSDTFPLTHEFIATMLCVRRSGVTVALHILEGDHLIKANRKYITVRDRAGLERRSDPSYGVAEKEYERLVGVRASLSHETSPRLQARLFESVSAQAGR
ncbi:Crp/Fnr family transcriptional regulator [Reyranella sp.]|uniref:Crp/Fnr family transcriptional regulator n=1 Tax=Reyranella sp. TaxID=1929291 RepID=UPI003D0B7B27